MYLHSPSRAVWNSVQDTPEESVVLVVVVVVVVVVVLVVVVMMVGYLSACSDK